MNALNNAGEQWRIHRSRGTMSRLTLAGWNWRRPRITLRGSTCAGRIWRTRRSADDPERFRSVSSCAAVIAIMGIVDELPVEWTLDAVPNYAAPAFDAQKLGADKECIPDVAGCARCAAWLERVNLESAAMAAATAATVGADPPLPAGLRVHPIIALATIIAAPAAAMPRPSPTSRRPPASL